MFRFGLLPSAKGKANVRGAGRSVSEMCDFVGQDFGACYPDSVCIDGYLWDADSGDSALEGGWNYTVGGELPCPSCNTKEAAKYSGKSQKKVRGYVKRMKEKWGTFGAPASLRRRQAGG